MRTIGISTVCNEADILEQSIPHALQFLETLYMVDCGSTDASAEILRTLAKQHRNCVFLGSIGRLVAEEVRRHIWAKFRDRHGSDDWWVIIDADEFIDGDVNRSLKIAGDEWADHVFGMHVNFYYTRQEYDRWLRGEESVTDRVRPIEDRRRYYRFHTSQPRAFRNLSWLRWDSDTSFPAGFSKAAHERLLIRHYQYRDPPQIESRIATRARMDLSPSFLADNPHWVKRNLDDALSDASDPNLRFWDGGEFFPDSRLSAMASPRAWKTVAKYVRAFLLGQWRQPPKPRLFQ